jgi:hypothetical protein
MAERPAAADAGEGIWRPPGEGLADTLVEARAEADLGGRWRIRARAAASVGEFLRWCALGKAELWSHGVNDARSGPAPNWRSRCRAEVCFNDANCLVRPQHLLSRPPS